MDGCLQSLRTNAHILAGPVEEGGGGYAGSLLILTVACIAVCHLTVYHLSFSEFSLCIECFSIYYLLTILHQVLFFYLCSVCSNLLAKKKLQSCAQTWLRV